MASLQKKVSVFISSTPRAAADEHDNSIRHRDTVCGQDRQWYRVQRGGYLWSGSYKYRWGEGC